MNNIVEVLGFTREPGWLPWAVQYFFLIGISTAALLWTLPGLVWRLPRWRGLSRRALLAALVCGLAAPIALLADLHQPGRFLNFYLQPNLQSWMAWGSFFIPFYVGALMLYAWLCLRPQLAEQARRHEPGSAPARLYGALAYGGHDNRGAIRLAACLAVLGALLVLLYTGMEVMVVRARPVWNTPLLPLLLAVTALTGALGFVALLEALAGERGAAPLLNGWVSRGQWVTLALLAAWVLSALTGVSAAAAEVMASLQDSVRWRVSLGAPVLIAALTLWAARRRRESLVLTGLLALLGAWTVRWTLLMGAQGVPKMGATFRSYQMTLAPDSVLGIVGTAGLLLTLYIALTSLVSWDETAQATGAAS